MMRSEEADVLVFTAGNTVITDMVRVSWRPPVRELGEVDDKYITGTVEILSFPHRRYGNQNKGMR